MTQTVKIPETEVTEDLIKYSMPGDCTACGIAITILENTGFFPVIWDDVVYLFKTQNGQYKFADLRHDDDKCEKVEEKPIQCFEVADDLSEWMNQFDSQPYTDPPKPIKIASTDAGELIIVD